jgi:hypothetical protein
MVDEHPSQAILGELSRHRGDAFLRQMGFRIHSRKKGKEPEWERNGLVMLQSKALKVAKREEK